MRPVLLIANVVVFAAVAAAALVDGVRDSRLLAAERTFHASLTEEQRAEYVGAAFDVPAAYRRFRAVLRPDERYAIVVPPATPPDRATLYHQYGLYYLYPALVARDLSQAETVLVLDPAQKSLMRRFPPLELLDGGFWIGRRR